MIDDRQLLIKYMRHVSDCEGITFVDQIGRYSHSVKFDEDEKKYLEVISGGIDDC